MKKTLVIFVLTVTLLTGVFSICTQMFGQAMPHVMSDAMAMNCDPANQSCPFEQSEHMNIFSQLFPTVAVHTDWTMLFALVLVFFIAYPLTKRIKLTDIAVHFKTFHQGIPPPFLTPLAFAFSRGIIQPKLYA